MKLIVKGMLLLGLVFIQAPLMTEVSGAKPVEAAQEASIVGEVCSRTNSLAQAGLAGSAALTCAVISLFQYASVVEQLEAISKQGPSTLPALVCNGLSFGGFVMASCMCALWGFDRLKEACCCLQEG